MAVIFSRNRLHVGYRKRDWTNVWYEPVDETDEEGGAAIGLYKLTAGPAGKREPMEGEVLWHPPFDIANCESKKAREREVIQKQTLADTHRYLAERDPEAVKRMEEELHDPNFGRWNTLFEEAKKVKRKRMTARQSRRRAREKRARDAGATEAEISKQINSDTSDDSAYESDGEMRSTQAQDMPPPPRRGTTTRRENFSKKQKIGSISSRLSSSRSSIPRMSGGVGFQSGASPRNSEPEAILSDFSDADEDMDTRDPNDQQTHVTSIAKTWDFKALITPESQPRVRGRSVGTASLHGGSPRRDPHNRQQGVGASRGADHQRQQSVIWSDEEAAVKEAIRRSQDPEYAEPQRDAIGEQDEETEAE